jgi:hypothetical protein
MKIPKRGKDLGTRCFYIYNIWEEAGHCFVEWRKDITCCYDDCSECEARGISDLKEDYSERGALEFSLMESWSG